MIMITHQQMVLAFEAWETSYRTEPEEFLTAEESAALEVSEASIRRADYFHTLLKAQQAEEPKT